MFIFNDMNKDDNNNNNILILKQINGRTLY